MDPKMYVSLAIQEDKRPAKLMLPLARASIVVIMFKMVRSYFFVSSFQIVTPLQYDKHVVNKNRVIRKSHDDKQNKCPHVVQFNLPRHWFEKSSRYKSRYFEVGKKIRGCRGVLERVTLYL